MRSLPGLTRCINSDERFRALLDDELGTLLRVARTLASDPGEAEDLVQDAVLRAWRAFDRFDGAHPRAWLLTIVRNTHLNRVRRQRPLLLADPERVPDPAAPDDPEAEAIAKIGDPRVRAELAKLAPRYRDALIAVDLGDLSYAEAAVLLDVPEGTVMSRVSRARARLRERLR